MDAFALDRFAPPKTVTFRLSKHGDREFAVDADPDVEDVARMLRIENTIRGVDDGDMSEALIEGKQLLLRMIQQHTPEVTELQVGAQELTVLFALFLHGSSVAAAVIETITASNASVDRDDPDDDRERDEQRDAGDGDLERGAPLASARRSSERSSSSDADEAGLLATGTA